MMPAKKKSARKSATKKSVIRNPPRGASKTIEIVVIQSNHGYGWEDESAYDGNQSKAARADLKEYRAARTGGSYRMIRRRVLRSDPSKAAR